MFTGIIEETGTIRHISRESNSARLSVAAARVLEGTSEGDSIAVNGVCLTVTSLFRDGFTADAMPETLARSTLGGLKSGDRVNLERAMRADGRFGGHIVSGHVDACGTVVSVTPSGIARVIRIRIPATVPETGNSLAGHGTEGGLSGYMPDNGSRGHVPELMSLIAVKGSVAVDGASLTVTAADRDSFCVSLIPHTCHVSLLGSLKPGDRVNVEADVFARYVARILSSYDTVPAGNAEYVKGRAIRASEVPGGENPEGLTLEFLKQNGF